MVQETQDFKDSFNIFASNHAATSQSASKYQNHTNHRAAYNYHSAKTPSPTLGVSSLLAHPNPPYSAPIVTSSLSLNTDVYGKQHANSNTNKRQRNEFSPDFELKSQMNSTRKNHLLNEFLPEEFHTPSPPAESKNRNKTVGPIQRPLTSSTSNPLYNSSLNNTLQGDFLAWLANNPNFLASLNAPNINRAQPLDAYSTETLTAHTEPANIMYATAERSSNPFEFKLFGSDIASPSSVGAQEANLNFSNEASIWNTDSKGNQAWNSVLLNDINCCLDSAQTPDSSSGNRIKSLWSDAFEVAEKTDSAHESAPMDGEVKK